MNWSATRRRLLQLAARRGMRRDGGPTLPGPPARAERAASDPGPLGRSVRAQSLCVASGKGGTGKSVTSAALATLLSARGRTLILDADLGVGNAHILQDVSPPHTCVDVVEGRRSARDVRVRCSGQIDLLAGGSGVPRMAWLSAFEMHLLASGVAELELDYRYLVVDSAAGVSRQTLAFAHAADRTLVVTTPDLTSMTDAYAFLKVFDARRGRRPLLLVNRARDEARARDVAARVCRVCERFLGASPRWVGWVPDDEAVIDCVNRRGSVAQLEPAAPATRALRRVAVEVLEALARQHAAGFGQRLVAEVGYAERLG